MLPSVTDAADAGVDELAGFAALMSGAAGEARPAQDEAPYGWMKDEATGEMRPKKSPGRPRKSPSLEDLKAQKEAESPVPDGAPSGDRPPAAPKGRRRGGRPVREPKPAPPVPQHLRMEGSLAKGINRLYRRAGRILAAMGAGPEGAALVEITRAEDPDDVTVGDAWEALCRSNPRIRAFWVRVLSGSAASQVFVAHLPVLLAWMSRPGVARRIPFWGLAAAVSSDDDQGESSSSTPNGQAPGMGGLFAGLSEQDVAEAVAFAQQMAGRAAGGGVPQRGE